MFWFHSLFCIELYLELFSCNAPASARRLIKNLLTYLLTYVSPVCGPCERISVLEVDAAIGKMKQRKLGGPTGVVSEMLKAADETGTLWMTDVCNAVVKDGKIPEDWSRSWMVNVYKEKGDVLACGSYRGIKLLEHAMTVLERVVEGRVRKIVKIDSMQFGFMVGRGTTDVIFSTSTVGEIFGKE